MTKMIESQKLLQKQTQKSNQFTEAYKAHHERLPQLLENYLGNILNDQLDMVRIKEGLKNKSLSTQEKSKNWQLFKQTVIKSCSTTMIIRGYLVTILLIKDLTMEKLNSKFDLLIEENKQKEPKFLSDSIESTKSFVNNLIESMIKHCINDILSFVDKCNSPLNYKLTDNITIDEVINRIHDIKTKFLSSTEVENLLLPDSIDLTIKRSGGLKRMSRFQLIHKRCINRSRSIGSIFRMCFKSLFTSSNKITTEISKTSISHILLTRFKDYQLSNKNSSITNHLFNNTKCKSCDKLSTITEIDEKAEDRSDLMDEDRTKGQIVYEEGVSYESKDYERQQNILQSLENIIVGIFDDFFDNLTSVNTQILMETYVEHNFKKLANRLVILKHNSNDFKDQVTFMKVISALCKIIEEEIIDRQSVQNDRILYQSRAKELFSLANKNPDDISLKSPEVLVNIQISEEAKLQGLLQRANREFSARLYFEEEFEEFYGEEFDKPVDNKSSPAKNEQQELMDIFSRLNMNNVSTGSITSN